MIVQKINRNSLNNKTSKILSLIGILFFLRLTTAHAQSTGNPSPLHFPTPPGNDKMLFYLQRDPNTNTLIYALNEDRNGNLNKNEPVSMYWIRYAEKGEIKDLGYIQRKFAYGLVTKEIGSNKFELRFVSHKKLPIYLSKRESDQKYEATTSINGKKIRISRLFVRIEGGSFWVPNVKYASIEGIDLLTQKPVTERINVK